MYAVCMMPSLDFHTEDTSVLFGPYESEAAANAALAARRENDPDFPSNDPEYWKHWRIVPLLNLSTWEG